MIDVTDDPSEAPFFAVTAASLESVDAQLRQALETAYGATGRRLAAWKPSRLNGPALVSRYLVDAGGGSAVHTALRTMVLGQNVVVLLVFNETQRDRAEPIVREMWESLDIRGPRERLSPLPEPLATNDSPRAILARCFPSMGGELPIRGGWGYTQADACVIDRDDPVVTPGVPFDGVGLEYVFVEKRIYLEMIVARPPGYKFSGIEWELLDQSLVTIEDRAFDQLTFQITAFRDADWEALKAEWEDPAGIADPAFDADAHDRKRESLKISLQRDFWFDITSFFGK